MRKMILAGFALLLLSVAPVWAIGGSQDPPGDGTAPSGITGGDAASGYVGPLFLEFRDIPNGQFQLQLAASRSLRVVVRLRGDNENPEGVELQMFAANFTCADGVPPGAEDVCAVKAVCTVAKNGRETCANETLVDFQAPATSYAVLVSSLLADQIILGYSLPAGTSVAVGKIDEFTQGPLIIGVDGVKSGYAGMDVAITAD
jgi:hypothetical protein